MKRREKSMQMKAGNVLPNKSLTLASDADFVRLRKMDPYSAPRDAKASAFSHSMFQEHVFYEVFPAMKNKIVHQMSIDVEHMPRHSAYFDDALKIGEKFGLPPLMEVNCD